MTVTASVQLPDQPTTGAVRTKALGGNGLISPHSETLVQVSSTGDAGGGVNRIYIRMDPRYVQLVAYVELTYAGAAADTPVDMSLTSSSTFQFGAQRLMLLVDAPDSGSMRALWTPPPLLIAADASASATAAPTLRVQVPNVLADVITVWCVVYNFDRRARELVPIEAMTRALVRSSTLI